MPHAVTADSGTRPALVGNGPKALVNQINVKRLMAGGGASAAVMFTCSVSPTGAPDDIMTYRGTGGSAVLSHEVEAAIHRSHFVPAIYHGKPVDVWFNGTVAFVVMDGKPRLRVYANQNQEDIADGKDFIAPQMIIGTGNWDEAKTELEAAKSNAKNGAVELNITVDAGGRLQDMKVISEDPPGYNFGHAAITDYKKAVFVPGFRDGRPVASSFHFTDYVWATRRLTRYTPLNPTHIGPQ